MLPSHVKCGHAIHAVHVTANIIHTARASQRKQSNLAWIFDDAAAVAATTVIVVALALIPMSSEWNINIINDFS